MSNFPNPGGGGPVPADVLTESQFPAFFNPQQVEYTGSNRIDSLDKLKERAASVTATHITLKFGENYSFSTLVDVGSLIVNTDGASLTAETPGAGLSGVGVTLIECNDESLFIGQGFFVLGDPNGSTRLFNLNNNNAGRNSFTFAGVAQFNNAVSNINEFKFITMAGQVDDCSSRFRISPNNAQSIRFQTMLMGDLVTATNAFELLIEAPSDCVIEMIDCTGRPGAFKNMFNIPNTTRQAKLINVSACTSAGDANGKILAGAGIADDNVISQANYGLAESRITGESGFNSVSGTNTSVTQNVWEPVTGSFSFNAGTAIGTAQVSNDEIEITKPVVDQRVGINCQISADASGGAERVCGLRISRSTDGGASWVQLNEGVNFTTRSTATSVCVQAVDNTNQGYRYRIEITNKETSSNLKLYTAQIQVL